jgi:excisionase family DNA binding protein
VPRRVPARRASITAAVAYAGVSRRTIYNWGQRGVITLYRVGPKLLQVDLDELDRHIRPVAAGGSDAA